MPVAVFEHKFVFSYDTPFPAFEQCWTPTVGVVTFVSHHKTPPMEAYHRHVHDLKNARLLKYETNDTSRFLID